MHFMYIIIKVTIEETTLAGRCRALLDAVSFKIKSESVEDPLNLYISTSLYLYFQ